MVDTLKLRTKRTKFYGICECGYEKEFKPHEDFNFKDAVSSKLDRFKLNKIYRCEECGKEYNFLNRYSESKEKVKKKNNKIVAFTLTPLFLSAFLFVYISLSAEDDSEATFHDTGNPEDMTNKEYQEFLEWQEKQDKKEWEDEKIFNDVDL